MALFYKSVENFLLFDDYFILNFFVRVDFVASRSSRLRRAGCFTWNIEDSTHSLPNRSEVVFHVEQ